VSCPEPFVSATTSAPRRKGRYRCPEPVSEINVAQPPLSEGSATLPAMGHLLGYARVSTTDQHPPQVDALQRAGCHRVFTETASGARPDRPPSPSSWTSCGPATPWSSGSSTASAAFCATWSTPSPAWPTAGSGSAACRRRSTPPPPGGKLVFHVFAALAEFERDLIRERTSAGLAAARARGRHGGRLPVMTIHKLPAGAGDVPLGAVHGGGDRHDLGVSRASIYRHLVSPDH
jgi:Resolvase, N terminal domain